MPPVLLLLAACGGAGEVPVRSALPPPPAEAAEMPFYFTDVAAAAGLTAPTWCGREDKPHLLESGGTGLALLDYDGDADLDLYLVNGWRLEGETVVERGANVLYRNRGDGTFDATTTDAGAPGIDGWSTGAVLFDADGDGDEDLYVAAYIDSTLGEVLGAEPTLEWNDVPVMLGPFGLEGDANRYFENLGGGRFREATAEAGLTDVGLYYSFAVVAFDADGDLDLDLYVANDSNPNYLYLNDGSGRFQEAGLWSGAALDAEGNAQGGMGATAGDVDGDGDPEIVVTNFERDFCTLYENLGDALFADATRESGVRDASYPPLSWGTTLSDLDLDGDLDLVIANGHIYPQADDVPAAGTAYAQANLLLQGQGHGSLKGAFVDVSDRAGPGFAVVESSRGLAVGDVDGDGDLDLALSNVDAPPTLLRNDTRRRGAWLLVDAPGALEVIAEAGGRRFVRHRVLGASYVSAGDPRFHLGLGPVSRVDRLTVVWPDGTESVETGVAVDRVLRVEPPDGE